MTGTLRGSFHGAYTTVAHCPAHTLQLQRFMTHADRWMRTSPTPDATVCPDDTATHLANGVARLRHDLRNALLPLMLHFDLLDLHARGDAPTAAASPDALRATIQRLANGLLMRTTDDVADTAPVALDLASWWMQFGDLVSAPLCAPRQFDARISPRLPTVLAHPAVLAQILLHVLVDARLAQADRHSLVQLSTRRTAHGVTLSIRDTGERMIVPRARPLSPALPAWGLCLAHERLAASGGALLWHTSPAHGTHVVLRLRAAGASVTAALGSRHQASSAARDAVVTQPCVVPVPATGTPAAPVPILIIDDNAALTTALALRLELAGGFACRPPLHALHNALAHILLHAPAIVLLDLNLPGHDRPLDLIRAVRDQHATTQVVILTGNPSRSAIDATRAAGAAGFIAKGIPPDRLLAALQRVGREPFVLELDT